MSDEERGELVNRDGKRGMKQAMGDGINVFQGFFAKLGVCGAVLCMVLFSLILGLAIPIAAIVIGVLYQHDCAAEPRIPLYLIVAGAGGLISNLLGTFCRPAKDDEGTPEWRKKVNDSCGCCVKFLTFINSLLGLFLFIWFIIGSVWVFGVFDVRHQCNPSLYWFSFATIVLALSIICGFILFVIGCLCCFACCTVVRGYTGSMEKLFDHKIPT